MSEFTVLECRERRGWQWCLVFAVCVLGAMALPIVFPTTSDSWTRWVPLAATVASLLGVLVAFYVAMTASIRLGKHQRARK